MVKQSNHVAVSAHVCTQCREVLQVLCNVEDGFVLHVLNVGHQ
jgi:hypothetical protein